MTKVLLLLLLLKASEDMEWEKSVRDESYSYMSLPASPRDINKEQVGSTKALIHSRHTSSRTYTVWREQVLTQLLADLAHSNQVLEWLVVMLILHLSCGIWVLFGINQQQNCLRHMTYI